MRAMSLLTLVAFQSAALDEAPALGLKRGASRYSPVEHRTGKTQYDLEDADELGAEIFKGLGSAVGAQPCSKVYS